MKWNTQLYDHKHDFVSKFGEDLINLMAPKAGEKILDLGCGTGDLAKAISQSGAQLLGIDSSPEMIQSATEKYPDLSFQVASADSFDMPNQFDAVFSNAALHWVLDKDIAVDCIHRSLKPGGRFVAELGGKGNVSNIVSALRASLNNHGYKELAHKEVWYFPSLSEYAGILEKKGFRVSFATHFDRKTPLKGEEGIKNWLYMFCKNFLDTLPEEEVDEILTEVEAQIKHTNFDDNQWFADYVRLRVLAVKR